MVDLKTTMIDNQFYDLFNRTWEGNCDNGNDDIFMLSATAKRFIAKTNKGIAKLTGTYQKPVKAFLRSEKNKGRRTKWAQVIPWIIATGSLIVAYFSWRTAAESATNKKQVEVIQAKFNSLQSNMNHFKDSIYKLKGASRTDTTKVPTR